MKTVLCFVALSMLSTNCCEAFGVFPSIPRGGSSTSKEEQPLRESSNLSDTVELMQSNGVPVGTQEDVLYLMTFYGVILGIIYWPVAVLFSALLLMFFTPKDQISFPARATKRVTYIAIGIYVTLVLLLAFGSVITEQDFVQQLVTIKVKNIEGDFATFDVPTTLGPKLGRLKIGDKKLKLGDELSLWVISFKTRPQAISVKKLVDIPE